MKLYRTLLASAALSSFVACSDDQKPVTGNARPLTAEQVTAFSVANSHTLLSEVFDLIKWFDANTTIEDLTDVLPFSGEADDNGEPLPPTDWDAQRDEVLADVDAFLNERLLPIATVESETDTAVTYKLDAQKACDFDPSTGDESEDGRECYDFVQATEIRVRVTSFAEGDLDLAVLAGADRDTVLRFELHQDLASAEVDLAPAAAILQTYFDSTGEGEGVVVHASGKARVIARRLADDQMRISAEVVEAIDAGFTDDEETVALTLGTGSVAIDIDAPKDDATLDVDMGAFTMTGPKELLPFIETGCYEVEEEIDGQVFIYEECDSEQQEVLEGEGTVSFGGLKLYVDLDDSKQELKIGGLALGKLGITADDKTIIEIGGDVNAAPVDLVVSDADDGVSIKLSDAFVLAGMFRTAQVPDLFDFGAWAADEDLAIAFGGETPTLVITDTGLRMSSGTATLTSKHASDTSVEVSAGQCMFYAEDSESEHPFDLTVADECPASAEPME